MAEAWYFTIPLQNDPGHVFIYTGGRDATPMLGICSMDVVAILVMGEWWWCVLHTCPMTQLNPTI
jgi:hypothetical protein